MIVCYNQIKNFFHNSNIKIKIWKQKYNNNKMPLTLLFRI